MRSRALAALSAVALAATVTLTFAGPASAAARASASCAPQCTTQPAIGVTSMPGVLHVATTNMWMSNEVIVTDEYGRVVYDQKNPNGGNTDHWIGGLYNVYTAAVRCQEWGCNLGGGQMVYLSNY